MVAKLKQTGLMFRRAYPNAKYLDLALFHIFMNDIYGFIKEADLANYADDNAMSYMVKL